MTHLDHAHGDAAAPTNGRRGWRLWSAAERTGFVSAVAGFVGVVIALLAWLLPVDPGSPTTTANTPGAAATNGPTTGPTAGPSGSGPSNPPASGPPLRYLNTIEAETGAANVRTTLPRALAGLPGYDHPIAIECPTNQTGDKVRQVTYQLRGRYLDFTATVRPYFTRRQDQDGQTRVTVQVGTRQPDDTMTTVRSARFGATPAIPAPLAVDVERGDVLTLAVECEFPDGVVVLANAGLTPAA